MAMLDGSQTYHAYLQEWRQCVRLMMLPQDKVMPLENRQIVCAAALKQAAVML